MMSIRNTDKKGHTISIMLTNIGDMNERKRVMAAICKARNVTTVEELPTPVYHIFG